MISAFAKRGGDDQRGKFLLKLMARILESGLTLVLDKFNVSIDQYYEKIYSRTKVSPFFWNTAQCRQRVCSL